MAVYLESQLQAIRQPVTTFKSQECYITFYKESSYDVAGKTRADMDPVGMYLFYWGFVLDEQDAGLTALQAFGSRTHNQRGVQRTESKLTVSGLYTQESDLDWLVPGHDPLLVFIDIIDDSGLGLAAAGNVFDDDMRVIQTLVVRDARLASKRFGGQDQGSVTHDLDFVCGQVHRLAQTTMDFTGDPLPPPPVPGTGGTAVVVGLGYGTSYGTSYGA